MFANDCRSAGQCFVCPLWPMTTELVNCRSVKSVSISKSGQRLYSVGNDGHVCEMDCTSGQVLSKFRAAKIPLACVAVAHGT